MPQIDEAKAVCGRCAVRELCLSYALVTRQDGIWGGTTAEERLRVRESSARRTPVQVARTGAGRWCGPGQTRDRPVYGRIAGGYGVLAPHGNESLPAGPARQEAPQ